MQLAALRLLGEKYPWPAEMPDVPEDWFGWFCPDTAAMLLRNLDEQTELVVELGTFLGFSSRAILGYAPNAHLICVDTWKGSPEHLAVDAPEEWKRRIATLFAVCQRNLWPWKDRLTLVREDSLAGLRAIQQLGLRPNLVYVDSEHTYDRVSRELNFCTSLWPAATIVGDDYNNGNVKLAADRHAENARRPMTGNAAAFCFPGIPCDG